MSAAAGRMTAGRGLATLALLGAACSCWAVEMPLALDTKPAPSLALDLSPAVNAPVGHGGAKPLDLGLRWRQPLPSEQHVDITAWRRTDAPVDAFTLARSREPVYGARVEMKLKPARGTRFVATHRFIGLQLESGDRIILRRKDGSPTLYYRTRF